MGANDLQITGTGVAAENIRSTVLFTCLASLSLLRGRSLVVRINREEQRGDSKKDSTTTQYTLDGMRVGDILCACSDYREGVFHSNLFLSILDNCTSPLLEKAWIRRLVPVHEKYVHI